MQKLKIQNTWNNDTKSFERDKFEVRETDGTISGKVSISSKKGDKWLSKPMPFTAFKSKIDEQTRTVLLHSDGKSFEASFNLSVDSFLDKKTNKETTYLKLIINEAKGEGISKHSQDKANGYVEEVSIEDFDCEIPF